MARRCCGILLLTVVGLVAQAAEAPSETSAELLTKENIVDISAARRQWASGHSRSITRSSRQTSDREDSRATLD